VPAGYLRELVAWSYDKALGSLSIARQLKALEASSSRSES